VSKAVDVASRSGVSTTEFKGKTVVQGLVILALILQRFGVDIDMDEQTAITIIGGLEAAYALSRSIVKAFLAKSAIKPEE
jgi:hypothetical protein